MSPDRVGPGDGGTAGGEATGQPRWSLARIALALVVVVGVTGGGAVGVYHRLEEPPELAETWYAPYVDVTLTPAHPFEDPGANPTEDVVLAFVVADLDRPCDPSWGAAYGLDEAATGLDLDRRIARYRQRGGEVVISFGGAINDELAVACTDPDDLADAYRSVVDRYEVTTIDLDVEGPALDDPASIERRATAIAAVQGQAHRAGRDLAVWLTLPVAPDGLTVPGVSVVEAMIAAGVDLGGVNVMTMSYGASRPEGEDLAATVERSVEATRDQLGEAYRRAGTPLDGAQLWGKVGATPMIGVNDALTDVYTLDDARALRRLARERGLGRVSIWSANRDAPCRPRAVTTELSNHCSGVDQLAWGFSTILDGLSGRPAQGAVLRTVPEAEDRVADDPATSPYPLWVAEGAYARGTKVVQHGQVYEAQWWTQGDDPEGIPAAGQPTPWRLVGPVLDGDRPAPPTRLPPGTHPEWSPDEVYEAGDRVLRDGVGYEAQWWTQGDDPRSPGDGGEPSPWAPLLDN